jgi:hypothetical protein
MIADHHAAAPGRRLLLAPKISGCTIPPIARHALSRFLLSFSGISRQDSSAAVFARDSQNSTILHHCKLSDSDIRDLFLWIGLGTSGRAAARRRRMRAVL